MPLFFLLWSRPGSKSDGFYQIPGVWPLATHSVTGATSEAETDFLLHENMTLKVVGESNSAGCNGCAGFLRLTAAGATGFLESSSYV